MGLAWGAWLTLLFVPARVEYITANYTITGASVSLTADLVGQHPILSHGKIHSYNSIFTVNLHSVLQEFQISNYYKNYWTDCCNFDSDARCTRLSAIAVTELLCPQVVAFN